MKKIFLVVVVLFFITMVLYFFQKKAQTSQSQQQTSLIHIVAAENFYGDIARQLGGKYVTVQSILNDPNIDPHEYESNVQDSIAVSTAAIVIKNGLGYDTWIDKLLNASPNRQRSVLTAGEIAPQKLPDNPHVWYSLENVSTLAQVITLSLKKLDPAHAIQFDQNLVIFQNSLLPLQQKIQKLHTLYAKTPVGLTETIYLYQTQPMDLTVMTPFAFQKAVAEGNDPPVLTVKITNDQVSKKQIKVLIYNSQTTTPLTTKLQQAAQSVGILVVPVSETLPQQQTYQSWMLNQLNTLEQALHQTTQK